MTDKDLAEYGERLWTAIIATELAPIEVGGLTAALRARTPWAEMGPGLKLALFRIARNAEPPEDAAPVEAPNEAAAPEEPAPDDGPPLDDGVPSGNARAADARDEKAAPPPEAATEAESSEGKT